jgi:hypothetical protein
MVLKIINSKDITWNMFGCNKHVKKVERAYSKLLLSVGWPPYCRIEVHTCYFLLADLRTAGLRYTHLSSPLTRNVRASVNHAYLLQPLFMQKLAKGICLESTNYANIWYVIHVQTLCEQVCVFTRNNWYSGKRICWTSWWFVIGRFRVKISALTPPTMSVSVVFFKPSTKIRKGLLPAVVSTFQQLKGCRKVKQDAGH